MKLNIILPWVLALGLGAGVAAMAVKNSAKDTELKQLRQQTEEIDQLRADLASAEEKGQLSEDQVVVSRKDKEELIRLRNEVGVLRDQAKRLTGEINTAKSQAQAAQSEAAQVTQTAQSNAAMLASLRADALLKQNLNLCINQLRQLDGAKQQWALENQKTAESIPPAAAIAPYLPGSAVPNCPLGGPYTINAVGLHPTCSAPGHALQ